MVTAEGAEFAPKIRLVWELSCGCSCTWLTGMSGEQVNCQSGAGEEGSLADEATDNYFIPIMNQARILGQRHIFVCHFWLLLYNSLSSLSMC